MTQHDEMRLLLVKFCEWLEDHIADPIRVVTPEPGVRIVEVFDCVSYLVDSNARDFSVALKRKVDLGWNKQGRDWIFEVNRPFNNGEWMGKLIVRSGFKARLSPGSTRTPAINDKIDTLNNIIGGGYFHFFFSKLLQRDPIFLRMRKQVIPAMFGLPARLLAMAMRARIAPVSDFLDSRTLNTVWKNLEAYELVARENPQLLTLLTAHLFHYGDDALAGRDPVQCIKQAMRESGISEAGWKYLTRHGARLFKDLWLILKNNARDFWHHGPSIAYPAAVGYLHTLQVAAFPRPFMPSMLRLLYVTDAPPPYVGWFKTTRHNSPAIFRSCAQEAARRVMQGMADDEFKKNLQDVFWWSYNNLSLPSNSKSKVDWSWLVNRRQKEVEIKIALAKAKVYARQTALDEFVTPEYWVVPLATGEEIVREGLAMRNCLAQFVPHTEESRMFYSVRHPESGKRIGTVSMRFNEANTEASLGDVRGFANSDASSLLELAASEITRRINEKFQSHAPAN